MTNVTDDFGSIIEVPVDKAIIEVSNVPGKSIEIYSMEFIDNVAKDVGRFFGVNEGTAKAIMISSLDLGLGLYGGFEFITVVQGRPTLVPRGHLAMAYRSGMMKNFKIEFGYKNNIVWSCTASAERTDGGGSFSSTFTLDDAKAAGLTKAGSGWTSYPKQMLQWRSVGFLFDVLLPDLVLGLGARTVDRNPGAGITINGEVVSAEVVDIRKTMTVMQRIRALVEEYTRDVVFAAAAGKMPKTHDEVDFLHDSIIATLKDADTILEGVITPVEEATQEEE